MHQSAQPVEIPAAQELVIRTAPADYESIGRERSLLVAEVERELPDEIVSPSEYTAVAALEERLGVFVAKYEPLFEDNTNYAHKAWKAACRIRDIFIGGPKDLRTQCKRLRGAYEQKEERARREEERRLAEAAQRQERERLAKEAKLLEKQGHTAMAAAVRQTPLVAPAVALPKAVPQVSGVTATRTIRTWRIPGCYDEFGGRKDKAARKRAAALVARDLCDLDDAAITARVNSGVQQIAGIEIYERKV
jgi:hypothetical protein